MKILSLELKLYKRLALNNINHFKLDLVSPVQLILGTNGSGKSSVLQELTPLPASKDNFRKGGNKTVVISHREKLYTLVSDFTAGQHHSFVVDGTELNDGGTVTIQKELVKDHFGITLEIHEMLLGIEVFSNMSPARRREWLTKLCTSDYTYAISLYKRIQENLNTTSGALKHVKKRLASEMVKALDEQEVKSIRTRISELTQESQSMYMLREVRAVPVREIESSMYSLHNDIEKLANEYRSIRRVLGAQCYFSPEELQSDLNDQQTEINTLQGSYKEISEVYMQLSAETSDGEEMDTDDLLALREKIASTKEKATSLLASRSAPIEGLRARLASDAMEAVYVDITSALAELPVNESAQYSPENLNKASEIVRVRQVNLSDAANALQRIAHELDRMEALLKGEQHECPKCEHTWVAGYSKPVHDTLIKKKEEAAEFVSTQKQKLEVETARMQEQHNYYTKRNHLHSIIRSCPELKPVWDELIGQGLINHSPQSAVMFLDRVRGDIRLMCMAEDLKEIYLSDMRRLEHAEYAQSANFKAKKEKIKELEARIGHLTGAISLKQRQYDSAALSLRRVKAMETIVERLKSAASGMKHLHEQAVLSIKNDLIDEALVQTHAELSSLTTRLSSIDAHERLVADITAQIEQLTQSEAAAKLLQKTLSPVDGLIAEGMLGFIRLVVARMNVFISQVWTYSMEVKDCSLEEDTAELNYKFPVFMAETGDTIPDVSRCSAGMVEMINLAFRVAASQCLGLDTGPLTLDEFGKTFDDAHREAATRVIAQMMESLSYSQLFMVSHYESSWGAFYKAQVTVVDKRNITLPSNVKYNENTLIAA